MQSSKDLIVQSQTDSQHESFCEVQKHVGNLQVTYRLKSSKEYDGVI